jgi:hypothetical protein
MEPPSSYVEPGVVQNLGRRRFTLERQSHANIPSPLAGSLPVSDISTSTNLDVTTRENRRVAMTSLIGYIHDQLEQLDHT